MENKIWDILENVRQGYITVNDGTQQVLDLFAVIKSLPIDRWDAEDFLLTKGISNHPQIQDSVTGNNNYEVADLIAEYANSFFRQ